MNTEYIVTTLAGSTDNERLNVVLVHGLNGESRFSLRQQSWADGIGWYDQKTLDLALEQFRQLQLALPLSGRQGTRPCGGSPMILQFPGVHVESA